MAEKKPAEDTFELVFPIGLNETVAYSHQPPNTSPLMHDVRIRGVFENRYRGGQRPGLKKAFATPAGTDRPVLRILNIVNTYIPPE